MQKETRNYELESAIDFNSGFFLTFSSENTFILPTMGPGNFLVNAGEISNKRQGFNRQTCCLIVLDLYMGSAEKYGLL